MKATKLFALILVVAMIMSTTSISVFADTTASNIPEAEVTVLPAMKLTAADNYMCWPNGDATIDRPLEIVMNFKAIDSEEDAKKFIDQEAAK